MHQRYFQTKSSINKEIFSIREALRAANELQYYAKFRTYKTYNDILVHRQHSLSGLWVKLKRDFSNISRLQRGSNFF